MNNLVSKRPRTSGRLGSSNRSHVLLLGVLGLLLSSLAVEPCSAQYWQQLKAPVTASVTRLYSHGADVYAVATASGGVSREPGLGGAVIFAYPNFFHSSDSGATWYDMSYYLVGYHQDLGGADLQSFAFVNGDLYSFRPTLGVLRSFGGFFVWDVLDTFMGNHGSLTSIAGTTNVLFAAMSPGGIVRYDSLRNRWNHVDAGLPDLNVTCLAAVEDTLFAVTLGAGIFRSDNLGTTWEQIDSEIGNRKVVGLTTLGHTLYLSQDDGHVFRSSNGGRSWSWIFADSSHYNFQSISGDDSNAYAVVPGHGVYFSTDGGMKWSARGGDLDDRIINSVAASGKYLSVGGIIGLYQSDTLQQHYSSRPISDGYHFSVGNAIAAHKNSIFYGTSESGILRSQDHGHSWVSVDNNLPSFSAGSALLVDSNRIIASGAYSDDDGDNWVVPSTPFSASFLTKIGDTIYAGGVGKLYYSTDHAVTWGTLPCVGVTPGETAYAVVEHDNALFAAFRASIYRSDDRGQTFNRVAEPDGRVRIVLGLHATKDAVLAATDAGIYRTTDDGRTWDTTLNGLQLECFIQYGNFIFAGGEEPYLSSDGGVSWNPDGERVPNTVYTSFAIADDGYLYASSYGLGVLRRPLGEVSVRGAAERAARGLALGQNYPNPFSQSTSVEFELADAGEVSFTLRDALGKVVRHSSLGFRSAGTHQIVLQSLDLAAGAYVLELRSGTVASSRRMILLR